MEDTKMDTVSVSDSRTPAPAPAPTAATTTTDSEPQEAVAATSDASHMGLGTGANVTIGPVIGKVTESSARILLEVDSDSKVTCTLSPLIQDDLKSHTLTLSVIANRPKIFVFDNLDANTRYRVQFDGLSELSVEQGHTTGHVRTYDPNTTNMRIVAASCDRHGPGRRGSTDMFHKLYSQYVHPDRVDLMIRHGDQAYCDAAYFAGLEILHDETKTMEQRETEIADGYRECYRATWMQTYTQKVLAHVPQLMLWDDHELFNDAGSNDQDRDPQSDNFKMAQIASKVYHSYQRQLWDDVDENKDIDSESHFHVWGSFAVMFVDMRASRSIYYKDEDAGLYIGKRQMARIREYLSDDGKFAKARTLIAVTSMPTVYLGSGASSCVACINPMKDKMGLGLCPEEQAEYLRLIGDWRLGATKDGLDRDAILIGGDLHYTMGNDIIDENGDLLVRQLVTSAISNKPPPGLSSCFLNWCCMWSCCNSIGDGLSIDYYNKQYERNFALLRCQADPTKHARVIDKVVFADSEPMM
jgi:PhoD-like phosphatase